MVTPSLSLEAGGLVVNLDGHARESGAAALAGLSGFGLPSDPDVRWASGAGDGETYRGTRQRGRVFGFPIMVYGPDRETVAALASEVARVLSPALAPATLRFTEPGGDTWTTQVVRTGGGDYRWGEDTDGQTWLSLPVTLKAGDPYFTRDTADSRTLTASGTARGLLGASTPLSALRLSSGQVLGSVSIENTGDADAWPVVRINGPATAATLTSPDGKVVAWSGSMLAGEARIFDHRAGTVVDETGANRYGELGPAPRFWAIPPGTRTADVAVEGTGAGSSVVLSWRPRRWLLF